MEKCRKKQEKEGKEIMGNTENKCGVGDLLTLFEDALSPADVLVSKLMAQASTALTKERLRLHMDQSEFAKHIGVMQSQVSRWEQGDYNFSLDEIATMAAKLNLDVNLNWNIPIKKDACAVTISPLPEMVSWSSFLNGESELECQSLDDAELLLRICKENGIDSSGIEAEVFQNEPYWYVKDHELFMTRYSCENEDICSCWTVKAFVVEHSGK